MSLPRVTLAVSLSLFSSSAFAQSIRSCDTSFTYDAPPTRAISLYQQATEIMLALGLQDRLIATAYLEDAIPDRWVDQYQTIPRHFEKLPAREVVLAENPDFLLAGFNSAWRDTNLGAERDWHAIGVGTYLVDSECRDTYPGNAPIPVETLFVDIERIGALFGVEARAAEVSVELRARLDNALETSVGKGFTAFLYDSGTDTPYSAGCCGSPALLMESVGLTNIAADVEGRWADLAWEAVMAADPDVIVINDAGWSTAEEKIAYMEADPVLSQLRAVRDRRYVTIPFSKTILGVRFVDGVERLAEGLEQLDLN